MKIMGITERAWTPYRPNLDGSASQRLERFQAFRSALQAGNLTLAQGAFAAFQKDIQKGLQNLVNGGAPSQHAEVTKDIQAIGDALAAGDIAAAQKAFTALKQDLQALYSGHAHRQASPKDANAEAANPDMPPPDPGMETKGNSQNTYA